MNNLVTRTNALFPEPVKTPSASKTVSPYGDLRTASAIVGTSPVPSGFTYQIRHCPVNGSANTITKVKLAALIISITPVYEYTPSEMHRQSSFCRLPAALSTKRAKGHMPTIKDVWPLSRIGVCKTRASASSSTEAVKTYLSCNLYGLAFYPQLVHWFISFGLTAALKSS